MPSLIRDGDVLVLDVGADENRFSPDRLAAVEAALDEVAAAPAPRALVTTATGRFFSNGLDLDRLGQHPDEVDAYVLRVCGLLARVLELGVPSVAALRGHTFAAGALAGKDGETLGRIKARLHADALAALRSRENGFGAGPG